MLLHKCPEGKNTQDKVKMKIFKMSAAVIILLALAFLCERIIVIAAKNQTNKIEYAEINHMRYGLLSIDTWKEQISGIVLQEVDKLEFNKTHEQELKKTLERQLNVLIDKVDRRMEQANKGTAKGWVKQKFIDTFVNIDDIKKGIPQYADAMIKEMKKPQAQGKIKDLLKDKITHYINQTFDTQDMSQVNRILLRVGAFSVEDANSKLTRDIKYNYDKIANVAIIMIILAIIIFLLPLIQRKEPLPAFLYISMVVCLLILLIAGVTTPMIDMEAKLSQMSFVLLDHSINFENQVLFFQTKSVLDVFWIMITHETLQMKAVGILMVVFSIVFPVFKLLSSVVYYYNYRNLRKNKIIEFFVLKSGKWSMADVMVVAIFMAYIGFNGIITSQFGKLKTASPELVILTTNGTSLQPGYYIFFTYAVLALFLSVYLARIPKHE